jgi:TonB family protein
MRTSSSVARLTALIFLPFLLLANALAADPGEDPEADREAGEVEVFRAPRPLSGPPAFSYPEKERQEHKEGWVILNMMIDPNGKPYEVGILDSTGNAVLEEAAIKAIKWMYFEPAKRGSTPIDSSLTFKMVFSTGDMAHGASTTFQNTFKHLIAAIDAGDKEQASAQLTKAVANNLYEDAFRSYAKYLYDRKWGTEMEQLRDLRRTVAGERHERYLPKNVFISALLARLSLEVKLKDYGTALETGKTLESLAPKDIRDEVQPTMDQIIALRNSDKVVTTPGQIDPVIGNWTSRLLKSNFALRVAGGAVSEIKLRCKKQYVFFKFDPTVRYSVSSKAGECSIEVVGDPGTSFDLVQS